MATGDIRPWTDPIAVMTKGRVTTYYNGVIRKWIDSIAIHTNGRNTSYMPCEGDIGSGRFELVYNNARVELVYNNARIELAVNGIC